MQTIRTLIVDDEPRIRRGIERLLRGCGDQWEVVATLSDGKEALEYIERTDGAIDLLITDVRMPEMDGLTLIKEAGKKYPFFPLVISGFDDFHYLQTALREGAVDYMLKPLDREQFSSRMAEVQKKISNDRTQLRKWDELERKAEKLRRTRQTQTLSYTTSPGVDLTRLGYWVEEFPKGRYLLMYVSLDTLPVKTRNYTLKDWEAYFYALENIMGEVVANHLPDSEGQSWCWRGGNSDFWTLLYSPGEEEKLLAGAEDLSERIRSAIRIYTPFSASIAHGEVIEDLYLLTDAKRQCLSLINYRLVYGGNRMFKKDSEEMAADKTQDREHGDIAPISGRLRQAVEQAELAEALGHSNHIFRELERMESPVLIQRTVQNVFLLIHSVAPAGYDDADPVISLEGVGQILKKSANLRELQSEIDKLIAHVIGEIESSRQSDRAKPVEQAKAWIRANLANDLTIKKIADTVYMNPTYFCHCFKIQTGETVLNYATRLRIERAKELLRDPHIKLQEVCDRIGYQDVKYFSKLFKEWAGQSPSKYREQMLR
ncbi:response regulator [Paenibacillus harenae]|uniref:response regulator n=1 Tax=Paenibacillus harenae TaxID=306543 RepID=UPI000412AC0A|nr:response regulator [Paenibacillus harenae]